MTLDQQISRAFETSSGEVFLSESRNEIEPFARHAYWNLSDKFEESHSAFTAVSMFDRSLALGYLVHALAEDMFREPAQEIISSFGSTRQVVSALGDALGTDSSKGAANLFLGFGATNQTVKVLSSILPENDSVRSNLAYDILKEYGPCHVNVKILAHLSYLPRTGERALQILSDFGRPALGHLRKAGDYHVLRQKISQEAA